MQKSKGKIVKNYKFLAALGILAFFVVFSTSYIQDPLNLVFNKNAKIYTEMYAYAKTKSKFADKYFVLQGNKGALSFFHDEVEAVEEDDLENVCSGNDTALLIYEKDSEKIRNFVQKKNGANIIWNSGTEIQFYTANIKGLEKSCHVGG